MCYDKYGGFGQFKCCKSFKSFIRLHGSVDRMVDFLIGITMAVWVRIPVGEKCPATFLIYIYIYIESQWRGDMCSKILDILLPFCQFVY